MEFLVDLETVFLGHDFDGVMNLKLAQVVQMRVISVNANGVQIFQPRVARNELPWDNVPSKTSPTLKGLQPNEPKRTAAEKYLKHAGEPPALLWPYLFKLFQNHEHRWHY